jgi:hypothetical protein
MSKSKPKPKFTRFPVVSHGAECLVMGYLMRRNILTYKAPPNNEGYDLICIHPDPKRKVKAIRIQVKSRLATDCHDGFPVNKKSLHAFDYLVVAFLNVGNFFQKARRNPSPGGEESPLFLTLPVRFIRKHIDTSSSWHKVRVPGLRGQSKYAGNEGFEQIAKDLHIAYPTKKRR